MNRKIDYVQLLNQSIEQEKPLVPPLTGSLQANKCCNSRCAYCGIWEINAKNPPVEDLFLAVNQLADLGVRMISITGGEPFLHPDLPQVIQLMDQRGILSSTMTNGLMLNQKKLVPILSAGINSLCVSLDTIDADIYRQIRGVALDPVLDGIRYVAEIRNEFPTLSDFSINCVISKANIHDLEPLIEFCNELNIKVGFQPLHNSFDSENKPVELKFSRDDHALLDEQIEMILQKKHQGYLISSGDDYLLAFPAYLIEKKLPEQTTCTAGYTSIAIDYQLNVKGCWPMRPIGNLHTQTLEEIWNSEAYTRQRAAMIDLDCPGCWLRCHTEHLSDDWLNNMHFWISKIKGGN